MVNNAGIIPHNRSINDYSGLAPACLGLNVSYTVKESYRFLRV